MMRRISWILLVVGASVLVPTLPCVAQPANVDSYDPDRVWSGTRTFQPASAYRTGSGRPGADYWQNRVHYTIRATLDTTSKTISGHVRIEYTNHSPTPLSTLWLELKSPYGQSSRADEYANTNDTLLSVGEVTRISPKPKKTLSTVRVDHRLQVRLGTPLDAFDGTTSLRVTFSVSLTGDRLPLYQSTKDGPIYQAANWYPRVATYDNLRGWTDTGTEFSGPVQAEYASFDYHITLPAEMIVAGSGTLMNPEDVLTSDQRRRLLSARRSSRKVAVISPDDAGAPGTRPQTEGVLTWHFRMNGTRDVAWAASPAFVWNAARINRPEMNPALAMSFYPPSSVGGEGWNRSTYHTQKSVQFFSKRLRAYPWNNAVNVAAPVDNKGFPGMAFCDPEASGARLFTCTVRGQAQNWFPRMVSVDPQRHPWMHAGFATFLTRLAHQHLYDGEFSSVRTPDLLVGRTPANRALTPVMSDEQPPLMTSPGLLTSEQQSSLYALKASVGLLLLRQYIFQPEHFDYAFRQFVNRWAYRQPTPEDFFRTINDVTGENLWWFWKGWFARNWTGDQRVADVSYVDGTPTKGARITVELLAALPMPVEAKIKDAGGTTKRVRLPVDVWKSGARYTFDVATAKEIVEVTLDPDDELPDANPSNDTWSQP